MAAASILTSDLHVFLLVVQDFKLHGFYFILGHTLLLFPSQTMIQTLSVWEETPFMHGWAM